MNSKLLYGIINLGIQKGSFFIKFNTRLFKADDDGHADCG